MATDTKTLKIIALSLIFVQLWTGAYIYRLKADLEETNAQTIKAASALKSAVSEFKNNTQPSKTAKRVGRENPSKTTR